MTAKEYLKQIEKLDLMINNKIEEIAQWKDVALKVTAFSEGDRVQSSSGKQKMADAINRCIDIEAEVNQLIDNLYEVKRDIISTIEQLNATEYDLLHKVYVQHKTLQDVADECYRSYSNITTLHGRALVSVQKILDERCRNEGLENVQEIVENRE